MVKKRAETPFLGKTDRHFTNLPEAKLSYGFSLTDLSCPQAAIISSPRERRTGAAK